MNTMTENEKKLLQAKHRLEEAQMRDRIFDPPESFLATCKKYWEDFYNEMMCAKPSVPTFYACDEDGTLYFYHGKSRIRVSEHFKSQGKTYSELAAEAIRFAAGVGKAAAMAS